MSHTIPPFPPPPPENVKIWDLVSFGLENKGSKTTPPPKWKFEILSVLDSGTKIGTPPPRKRSKWEFGILGSGTKVGNVNPPPPEKIWDFGILSVFDFGTKVRTPSSPPTPPSPNVGIWDFLTFGRGTKVGPPPPKKNIYGTSGFCQFWTQKEKLETPCPFPVTYFSPVTYCADYPEHR